MVVVVVDGVIDAGMVLAGIARAQLEKCGVERWAAILFFHVPILAEYSVV